LSCCAKQFSPVNAGFPVGGGILLHKQPCGRGIFPCEIARCHEKTLSAFPTPTGFSPATATRPQKKYLLWLVKKKTMVNTTIFVANNNNLPLSVSPQTT